MTRSCLNPLLRREFQKLTQKQKNLCYLIYGFLNNGLGGSQTNFNYIINHGTIEKTIEKAEWAIEIASEHETLEEAKETINKVKNLLK